MSLTVTLPTYALITAPTADVVTLVEAKAHVRASEFSDDDLWLGTAVKVFAGKLDAQRGWLGRALRPQTWEYRLDRFARYRCGPPYDRHADLAIELPFPPFVSLTSLKYDDQDGVERTLVKDTDFKVVGEGSDQPVHLVPMYGGSWPSARCTPESVRIRYQCGYAEVVVDPAPNPHPDLLPPEVKLWILANLATAYENRESVVLSKTPSEIATISDDLVAGLKVWSLA